MYDQNSQDFYANFVWYIGHEDQLALEERDNQRARAVRDMWNDLFPIRTTTESQVRDFNRACKAYREEAENTVQMTTRN